MPFVAKGAAARNVAVHHHLEEASKEGQAQAPTEGEVNQSGSQSSLHSEHTHELAEIMDMELETQHAIHWTRKLGIKILTAPAFDYVLGFIIVGNMFVMIIEIDQSAKSENSSSSLLLWMDVIGWIVLIIFILELLLRLFVFECYFWHDAWNIFDFIVVAVDFSFSIVGLVVGDAFPVSILRIFRLAKLARVSKVLRIFPELRLMLAGLVGSVRAIFWGVVLLVLVILVWAMVAVLFIYPLAKNMDCEKCPDAYDSIYHASLTFWQEIIAGDSWGQVTIPVVKKYPATIFFFMPLFMTVGMAVMNLILGVVVNVALNAKDQIAEEDNVERKMFKMEQRTHLLDLCRKMDVKKTGRLSRQQVFTEFQKPGEFQDSMRFMDISDEDLHIIWTLLDRDKVGSLPYKALMNKLYSVRDSDTQFMLAYIKYYTDELRADVLQAIVRMEAQVERDLQKVEIELEEGIEDIHKVEEELGEGIETHKPISPVSPDVHEAPRHGRGRDAHGIWQVLDESKQSLNSAQYTSKANNKDISSFPAADNSHENLADCMALQENKYCAAFTSVNAGNGDWDMNISHVSDTLKTELQDILIDMNQKLESQVLLVSLMNQKVCTASWEPVAKGSQARSRAFITI